MILHQASLPFGCLGGQAGGPRVSSTSTELMLKLYDLFIAKFNDEELADLAFAMGISIKELGEETTKGKARELAAYIIRHEWVTRLAEIGPRKRSDVNWAAVLKDHVSHELLSDDDRRRLVDILANDYSMQLGPATRLSMLAAAGLQERIKYIDLANPPFYLAQRIVADLEPLGILSGRPSYHALGALIDYIRLQPDTPKQDARTLAELLVRYQLIADPAYLDKLAVVSSSDVTPVRQIDPSLLPPPVSPVPMGGASVETTVDEPEETPTTSGALAESQGDGGAAGSQPEKEPTSARGITRPAEDDFIDIELLAGGIYAAQAVGRIERPEGTALGTGFLIGPDLLLTTQYVLQNQEMLNEAVIRFDYYVNVDGVATIGRVFDFSSDLYVSSPPGELDFALVRVKGEPLAERKMQPEDEGLDYLELLRRGRHRGYLLVSPSLIVEYERVNLIQHPRGGPQKAVLTQNYVLADMTENRVHYLAVTQPGSGGSPVFNRRWEVVALHHARGAHPPLPQSGSIKYMLKGYVNFKEGIPMRAILPEIERYLPQS
jgi:hypothetical protein